jgi:hypothetical protein
MTDTYLPEVFIHSVLKRFLDFDYTLLCSSATGKTKRSGSAFVHLHSEFRYKRIVHFGVNFGGKLFQPLIDIENASLSPHRPPRSQIIDKYDSIETAKSLEASGLVFLKIHERLDRSIPRFWRRPIKAICKAGNARTENGRFLAFVSFYSHNSGVGRRRGQPRPHRFYRPCVKTTGSGKT